MGLRRSKRSAFVVAVPLVVLLGVGCSYDWTFTPDPTVGGVGVGSVGDGAAPGDGAVDSGGDATRPPDKTDGATPNDGTCGKSTECPKEYFCQFQDKVCGHTNASRGVCVPLQVACTEPETPVCTCNGTTALGRCAAARDGLDVDAKGNCADFPVGETFDCPGSDRRCRLKAEYCRIDKLTTKASCAPFQQCTFEDGCACTELQGCTCQSPSPGAIVAACPPP